ncbi:hypothetical protein MWN34_03725 [Ancylobacter sp. 6x-1]|uniref:Antifreeze protein n=1 Tax=Ancylobacter crimeensis TaxID=2579147 RepID=A0ABT0D7T5_9HYPH|nr:hypothetical protein [Ancylobacter crimeensis]MCK0196015.1 hypothetical protein [Ancylobacter crimeensis]
MRNITAAAVCAALIATTPLLVPVVPAHAQGFNIEVGPNGVRPVPPPDYGYDDDRGPPPGARMRGGCSERQARAAARDEGLRNAEVVSVTPRSIVVEGDTRRGPERIRFANRPGCPTLG